MKAHIAVISLLVAALALGCEKADEGKPAGKATTDTSKGPADPAGAARPKPMQVRPPTAEDLAEYTKDLTGDGPLQATFETTMGDIHCELFASQTPITVANFVGLARGLKPFRHPETKAIEMRPFFDGLIFHRVIPGFMVQGGDPLGVGTGGPGYRFKDEIVPELQHQPGSLSMANAGPGTNGSQFFITEVATTHLNGRHTVFGQCKEVDLIKQIARVERGPRDRPLQPIVINRVVISRGE